MKRSMFGSLRLEGRLLLLGSLVACVVLGPGCDTNSNEEPPSLVPLPLFIEPEDPQIEEGQQLQLTARRANPATPLTASTVSWTSLSEGVATVDGEGRVTGVSPGETVVVGSIQIDGVSYSGSTVVTVVERSGITDTVIEVGVYPVEGLTGIEAVSVLPKNFGGRSASFPGTIAGNEGFLHLDFATRVALESYTGLQGPIGSTFGATGLRLEVGADTLDGIYQFAQTGYAFHAIGSGAFVTPSATAFDALVAGDTSASGWATVALPGEGVRFIAPGFGEPSVGFGFTKEVLSASELSGELVSAYMSEGGTAAAVLALTRDVQSKLYYYDRSTVTLAEADLGLDARRIRCAEVGAGYLCAVSLFGDDAVALLPWSGSSPPSLATTASVGDGPVGLDIHQLSNGNLAVALSAFNDSKLAELEVEPSGTVVSNETRDAPSECQNLGHVSYVRDSEGLKLIGTCYSSNNFFVTPSRF